MQYLDICGFNVCPPLSIFNNSLNSLSKPQFKVWSTKTIIQQFPKVAPHLYTLPKQPSLLSKCSNPFQTLDWWNCAIIGGNQHSCTMSSAPTLPWTPNLEKNELVRIIFHACDVTLCGKTQGSLGYLHDIKCGSRHQSVASCLQPLLRSPACRCTVAMLVPTDAHTSRVWLHMQLLPQGW
jgi:hypothetical protein